MSTAGHIIVVEDEPLTRQSIVRFLEGEGYEVRAAADVAACRAALRARSSDLVVLDLGLPGADGLTLARELKNNARVGVIIITMRGAPHERIEGLDSGADDYMVKPVHFGELAARIRAQMRTLRALRPSQIRFSDWILDISERSLANCAGASVHLTRGEFEVLAALAHARGKIVDREALSGAISGQNNASGDIRSVDALVSRVRRKLGAEGKDLIVTAPGFGYRLSAAVEFPN